MNVYKIADLLVGLDCQERTMNRAEKYMIANCGNNDLDFIISTTMDEILKVYTSKTLDEIKAYLYEGRIFYRNLISKYHGMMIHASAVVVDDRAYLFSAPCGTGKSTHTNLWLKLFGDSAYILNDDKPAVRILEDGIYVYGTPWSGKNDISANKKVKLQGICFLQRDSSNWIERISNEEAVINLFRSSLRKLDSKEMSKLFEIIEKITISTPIFRMGCTPTIEAAQLAYNIMSGEKQNEKI